jgi:flavin reductase (DIM6/NTAB) family NADH-FMN oxidoreductase RutF
MPLPDHAVGPVPVGRTPEEYDRMRRRVLWSMPTGLFVVGSRAGRRRNLMTCNWVMQVATVPKLVAVSVEVGSVTRSLIERGGGFSVSVLPRSERAVIRRFVKPVQDVELDESGDARSMQGVPVHEVSGGLPCLSSALAWMACEVRHSFGWDEDAGGQGSHVLVVGEVVDAGEGPAASDAGTEEETTAVLQMRDTRLNYGG